MGYIGNPLDPWGAADPATAYGAAFEAMAASGAYDVLVLVHDFPYRSLPSEVATANEVTRQRSWPRPRERPGILPVYVSLTSGEPPPETKALLDAVGGGAPLLRGAIEAFRAIAQVARLGGAVTQRRVEGGPWRAGWPALAADRTSYGADPAPRPRAEPTASSRCPSARAWRFVGAAGIAVTEAVAVTDAAAAVAGGAPDRPARSRSSSTPSGSPTRAMSAASRSGCAATMRSTARRSALLEIGRRRRAGRPRAAGRADGRRPASS